MSKILRISSSPAQTSIHALLPAGVSESDSDARLELALPDGGDVRVAALEKVEPGLYREDLYCADCGGERQFEEVFRFDLWRMFVCLGCDAKKFIPWTRTNSEAA